MSTMSDAHGPWKRGELMKDAFREWTKMVLNRATSFDVRGPAELETPEGRVVIVQDAWTPWMLAFDEFQVVSGILYVCCPPGHLHPLKSYRYDGERFEMTKIHGSVMMWCPACHQDRFGDDETRKYIREETK